MTVLQHTPVQPTAERAPRPTILHVVESLASGVATALEGYMLNTPEYRHVVLGGTRPGFELRATVRGADEVHALPSSKVGQAVTTLQHIRAVRPDVVHCHSSWAGTYGRVAATLAGSPVFYSPHGYAFLRDDVAAWKRQVFRGIEALLSPLTTRYVTAGPRETALTRTLRRRVPVSEALPALVAEEETRLAGARPATDATGSLDIVTLGRISAQKDPSWFIATVESLRGAGWTGTATWIGGGEEDAVQRLTDAGIDVTGWMRRTDGLERLAGAGVYLHTAAWEAGIPYSILEAGLLGLPVVARHLEELTDRSGLRLASDPHAAAQEILRLQADAAWRSRVVSDCTDVVDARWRAGQRDNLVEAYGSVCEVTA